MYRCARKTMAVWFAQLAMIWGIAHVITGFRDHQLLSSVMPERHETEETADETAL